ncbi:MAG: type II secretion system F family protein [Phycisphaerales bacterium]|nr:MAG: type II secretion system F family protein [Phycisphaerales bacterium]
MNLVYQAVDGSGRRVNDIIEAGDVREAVEKLRRTGLLVIEIEPASDRTRAKPVRAHQRSQDARLPLKPLLFFTKQMAMLLRSGSGVVPALTAVRRQLRKPGHLTVVNQLISDLEQGVPLADAMGKHPRTFEPSYRAVIAAGEASATMPDMFDRLAGILGRRRALRNKIIGALAYPAFLILLCTKVLAALLLFVIPRFAVMFETLRLELPASTSFLLSLSSWLRSYWEWLVIGIGAAVIIVTASVASATGRQFLIDIQTEIPLFGRLASRLIQGQLFRTLGTLIECRVGLLEALELCRGVTGNRRFRKLIHEIEESVTGGDQISSALMRSGFISPSIYYSIHTGEESGNLGPAISFCAQALEEDNTELIGTLTRLFEPMILLLMGVVVGTVAVSLFLPLFDMTAAIG